MKKAFLVLVILLFNFLSLFSITIKQVGPDRIYFYSNGKDLEVYCNNSLVNPVVENGILEIDNLWPESEYEIIFVYSDGKQEKFHCVTSSWQGFYRWINTSNNTNKGRCKDLTFYVEKAARLPFIEGVFYNIYEVVEGYNKKNFRIFPLVDLNERGDYPIFEYKDDNKISDTYRRNALSFNTTSVQPLTFWCSKITIKPNEYSIEVKTKSFVFNVNTITTYKFMVNKETGKNEIWFILDGDGLAKIGMFKNPVPREGTDNRVFILEFI